MIKNKLVFTLLAALLLLKFAYVPWSDWVDEKQQSISQLSAFYNKQEQAINNKNLLQQKFDEHQKYLSNFKELMPKLNTNEKANTLWFTLIESIKNKDIKMYNQKVEFEETITNNIGYITGSVSISGEATHVMQAILTLEAKAPTVFLDKLSLNRTGKANNEILVAQLYIGYWFSNNIAMTP
jgi:hypothetical protein